MGCDETSPPVGVFSRGKSHVRGLEPREKQQARTEKEKKRSG